MSGKGEALTDLLVEYLDGHKWRLLVDFAWRFRDGLVIVVPEDFVSDKHSVPRPFWSLVPPHLYGRSAIIHDWVYAMNGEIRAFRNDSTRPVHVKMSRREADLRYREMLADAGAGIVLRNTMYRAVRAGGWVAWRRHAKRNQSRYSERWPIQTQ